MKPRFFRRQSDFRRWLEANHEKARELWVGYYKTGSGKPSLTWPQSVDEALCFGWIDAVRKSIDEVSYTIRFTPRKPASVWSAINIKRAEELGGQGLMQPAGLRAFEARKENRSGIYSYENRPRTMAACLGRHRRRRRRGYLISTSITRTGLLPVLMGSCVTLASR
ncbi:MAG: bacteriocin-protection protein [Luteitalea sp.]|nr:bacteriocin-protection protein [Luteitalea sp.]